MEIQNIQALAKLMEALGFSSALDKKLAHYACFRQKEFSINEQKNFGMDTMSYQLFFKQSEADKKIVCSHYDAALRKEVKIEPVIVNEIDLHKLDGRMKAISWQEASRLDTSTRFDLADKETWKQYLMIEQVIQDLEVLSATNEGKNVAGCLQYKYWIDLPLERLIPNLFIIKSKLENTQRFYVINDQGITADEAYRFLNNRWMQRQMQVKKRTDSFTKPDHLHSEASAKDGRHKKRKIKTK